MQKITGLIVIMLFIFTIIPVNSSTSNKYDLIDGGWIEKIDNITILHLSGSYYEMGYQHGYLLGEECLQNLRALLNFSMIISNYDYEDFKELWMECREYVPQEYIEEMQGMADSQNVSLEKVAIGNIVNMWIHCSGMSAWGNSTLNGELLQMRSLDFPLIIRDPISVKFIQENSIIIIRKPENAFASIDPSFAGLIGSLGGFNEKGIAIEVLSSWCNDETNFGTPMVFRQRMILDYAENYNQAIEILTKNKTFGWINILSDACNDIGLSVETTANTHYYGTWNNSVESTNPFWQIPEVVRRTNIFISPDTASTQREIYDPSNLPFINMILGRNKLGWSFTFSFIPWIHYKALSEGIEDNYGKLDINSTMSMIRDLYQGVNNNKFKIIQIFNLYSSLHQWVANPNNGDIVISFADKNNDAFENSIHYFNFYKLLNSEPP